MCIIIKNGKWLFDNMTSAKDADDVTNSIDSLSNTIFSVFDLPAYCCISFVNDFAIAFR